MTRSIRPILLSAFALASIAVAGATPSPAAAASGTPPFCILRGSVEGSGGSPQDCRYYDWQTCLETAAVQRGNCVQNIDYHGAAPSSAATPGRARQRR